ncbi:hypothetical protein DFP74_5112 [Nocardiopsis sp. Huas11]|uniref:hypothetical protein n=1 Tax=Nocardiopsis sp. Huas11 TaxID=2183912 RepID=UPI000EB323B1|nr:hypothetical protein [Nocardiopsis sp. Huas11]RKS09376.1 hypothetical protein DFP74_5112 [Nocardiopsis sp. Huas11]
MPIDDRRGRELLRRLDDPDHLEFPPDYDDAATGARFARLVTRLNDRFDCACGVDRCVEDASYHGTVIVPATATDCGRHITVTVSNFGDLAAVTLSHPGRQDGEKERALFRSTDRPRVEGELEALGYVSISEHLLGSRYGGDNDFDSSPGSSLTWWLRFFDYP